MINYYLNPHLLPQPVLNDDASVWTERLLPYRHGSPQWLADKDALTLGSSESAAVYPNGVSTTVKPADLRKKILGLPRPQPDAYLQDLFAQGQQWEAVMLSEIRSQSGLLVVENTVFRGEEIGGVRMVASPDAILVNDKTSPSTLALLEIKFRTRASPPGWPGPDGVTDDLGTTVWCQVQHQMWVTGIRAAYVYSGNAKGERLVWAVDYCPAYIIGRYEPAIRQFIANPDFRHPRGASSIVKQSLAFYMQGTARPISPTTMHALMNNRCNQAQ